MAKNKTRPNIPAAALPYDEAPDYEKSRPTFCLKHLDSDFSVKNKLMTKDHKAAFAEQLETLSSLTWEQIKSSGRHKLGMEKIGVGQFKCSIPSEFEEEKHLLVFRYHGKLPMAGVRRGAMFHLIALERAFDELYKH